MHMTNRKNTTAAMRLRMLASLDLCSGSSCLFALRSRNRMRKSPVDASMLPDAGRVRATVC